MCKLVPFKAQTGKTVMVADIKVDKLNKYLEMFPKLTMISFSMAMTCLSLY